MEEQREEDREGRKKSTCVAAAAGQCFKQHVSWAIWITALTKQHVSITGKKATRLQHEWFALDNSGRC